MSQQNNSNWVTQFIISETTKHKKGFTVYKITSNVYPKTSPEGLISLVVWKRFNDIKNLHHELKSKHKNLRLKGSFPELCKASYFKRFEGDVIESRKNSALQFLNFVASETVLFTSQPFVKFFESGFSVSSLEQDSKIAAIRESLQLPQEGDLLSISTLSTDSDSNSLDSNRAGSSTTSLSDKVRWPLNNTSDTISNNYSHDGKGTTLDKYLNPNQRNIYQEVSRTNTPDDSSSYGSDKSGHRLVLNSSISLHLRDSTFTEHIPTRPTLQISKSAPILDHILTPPETPTSLAGNEGDFVPHDGGSNYIFEAAYHFSNATQFEASLQYESAFCSYKKGIAKLLSGMQDDDDQERRQIVLEKTNRYLSHAEKMYTLFLDAPHRTIETEILSIPNEPTTKTKNSLERPLEELRNYKVLDILDSVMLVMNVKDKKCSVIKAIHKSSNCPHNIIPNIFPTDVPYMVPILHYFQSESAIYLLVKQASGGKLWDHIKASLYTKSPASRKSSVNIENIFTEPVDIKIKIDNDEVDSNYLELVTNYAAQKLLKKNKADSSMEISFSEISSGDNCDDYFFNSVLNLKPDDSCLEEAYSDEVAAVVEVENKVPSVANNNNVVNISFEKTCEEIRHHLERDIATDDLLLNAKHLLKSVSATLSSNQNKSARMCNVKTKLNTCRHASMSDICRSLDVVAMSDQIKKSKSQELNGAIVEDTTKRFHTLQANGACSIMEPSCTEKMQEQCRLPESLACQWGAELLLAVEGLHKWGVLCRDLHRDNLLLGEHGQLWLSYQCSTASHVSDQIQGGSWKAPEVSLVSPHSTASDWWNYGALLFELVAGLSLDQWFLNGITSHSILEFPEWISPEASSLLNGLLAANPVDRLKTDEIKSHLFFKHIDWTSMERTFHS